jgi:hypothetical protein
MKKQLTILLFLIFIAVAGLFSQEKAPVAEDDYLNGFSLKTDTFYVCRNDFAYRGNPFKIILILPSAHSATTFNDSAIIYTPDASFSGTDLIRYKIKDMENGLLSNLATTFIQVENKGNEILGINNVHCRINAANIQFWDINSTTPYFEVPANSGIMSVFTMSLWMGGIDEQGNVRVATDKYSSFGSDYFQGPVMDSVFYSTENDIKWNRVWKLNQTEIDFHRAHWNNPDYVPIKNIAEWPGNGDTMLGQERDLAPYFDIDDDGNYDAHHGDFPIIKGDQTIFFIYNDHRGAHYNSGSDKMEIEVHALFYAFNHPDDSALYSTVFADYKVFNRSENVYNDVYTAGFVDFDLGSPYDDFIGCDSLLDAIYVYNGLETDGSGGAGEYGLHPPAQGITCLNFDMNGFINFQSYLASPTSDPNSPNEYYNYMKNIWRDLTHLTYGGTGHGGEVETNFAFSGNPHTGEGWTEPAAGNEPGDRRGIYSSGPYSFNPGDMLEFEVALVFARDYPGNNLSSVGLLKKRIADVREFYALSARVDEPLLSPAGIEIYPNPFIDFVEVEFSIPGKMSDYVVFDIHGKVLQTGHLHKNDLNSINFTNLKKGVYFFTIKTREISLTKKLIKL